MIKHYTLEPEVAGGLGPHTVMDRSVHPPIVTHLHYHFDGWLGDELVESFPCYVVTQDLADRISRAGLTGVQFEGVEVTVSDEFRAKYPGMSLPQFLRLKPTGVAGRDDFGVGPDLRLVVSDRALAILKARSPRGLDVSDFAG